MTNRRQRWRDLTYTRRVAIVVGSLLQVALMATALWDIHHRSPDEIHGSKRMWTAAAFINFVGPIAYLILGRKTA